MTWTLQKQSIQILFLGEIMISNSLISSNCSCDTLAVSSSMCIFGLNYFRNNLFKSQVSTQFVRQFWIENVFFFLIIKNFDFMESFNVQRPLERPRLISFVLITPWLNRSLPQGFVVRIGIWSQSKSQYEHVLDDTQCPWWVVGLT